MHNTVSGRAAFSYPWPPGALGLGPSMGPILASGYTDPLLFTFCL